jgi:endonuclease III
VHEENQFVRDATSEELAEVYAPETVASILSARETRDEAAEVTRQMMARMKRENPEFVANSFKGQAQDIVGRIKQTVEQLNMYQERVNSTHDKPAWLQALNESWVERFKGNLLDLSEGLNSIVSVSGDLVKQRDDGTFTLSNFSLSYDGVGFLQHQE